MVIAQRRVGTESGLQACSRKAAATLWTPVAANGDAALYAVKGDRPLMNEQHFTPDMTVDQAFKLHAGARRVFARFHLGGCSHCAISETHTIGAISEDYGIPLPMLLENLNALFDQATLSVGDRVRIPDEIRDEDSAAGRRSRDRRDHRCRRAAPIRPSSATCACKGLRKTFFRPRPKPPAGLGAPSSPACGRERLVGAVPVGNVAASPSFQHR